MRALVIVHNTCAFQVMIGSRVVQSAQNQIRGQLDQKGTGLSFENAYICMYVYILVGYATSVYKAGDRTTTTMLSSLVCPYRQNANVL